MAEDENAHHWAFEILSVFPHCLHWNTYYILIYLMMVSETEKEEEEENVEKDVKGIENEIERN